MNTLMNITKSNGVKELFQEEKLVNSLRHVGATDQTIDEITEQVEKEMREDMTTTDIYSRAFELLRKHSHHTAAKYSIRRAMLELGPDGFPFEKFVARIFKMWGYEVVTDQTLAGACVEHEVDVVAWNDEDLAMVEAKYHNEFVLKSDLKVVLYVKARFDDLSDKFFDYGGKRRRLSERYLFTNTKFTDKAIAYGECNRLKLIGWNYPNKQNLHDIIEDNGLQPITCLTSITRDQKRDLVGRNILVCVDLIGHPEVLEEIGFKKENRDKVIAEAQEIIETGA